MTAPASHVRTWLRRMRSSSYFVTRRHNPGAISTAALSPSPAWTALSLIASRTRSKDEFTPKPALWEELRRFPVMPRLTAASRSPSRYSQTISIFLVSASPTRPTASSKRSLPIPQHRSSTEERCARNTGTADPGCPGRGQLGKMSSSKALDYELRQQERDSRHVHFICRNRIQSCPDSQAHSSAKQRRLGAEHLAFSKQPNCTAIKRLRKLHVLLCTTAQVKRKQVKELQNIYQQVDFLRRAAIRSRRPPLGLARNKRPNAPGVVGRVAPGSQATLCQTRKVYAHHDSANRTSFLCTSN